MLWLVPNSLKKPTSFGPELLVRFCGRFCQRRCVASVPADALRAHSRSSTDERVQLMPTSFAISILSH